MRFGFGKAAQNVHGYKSKKGPKTFWMAPGTETTIVLLDDLPCEVCRHQLYIKGDRTAAQMRQTCAGSDPAEFQNPVPRQCIACNAMLRNKVMGRKGYLYLSMIEEREFQWKGKTYKDMKMLLELDPKMGDLWERRRDSHGGLVGARFKVYRSQKQQSARTGDDWNLIEKVDLTRNFWYSPGVTAIVEAKQKAGERIEHEEAVKLFVSRYHYETMIDNYDAEEAQAFVDYAGGGATAPQQSQPQSQSGNNVPPPPPAQGQADYSTGQSVPASQAPTVPPPPAQTQPSAPAQGQQTPPPPPPDPAQASGRQAQQPAPQGYQAPPPPPVGQSPAPQQTPPPPLGIDPAANQRPATPPPPPPQGAPAAQAAPAGAVGGNYNFEDGWSKDEPF